MVSGVDVEANRLLGVSAGLASCYPVTVEHDSRIQSPSADLPQC